MDAVHYDLNTCLREMLIMLKSLLRVSSSDDLVLFQMTLARFEVPRPQLGSLADSVPPYVVMGPNLNESVRSHDRLLAYSDPSGDLRHLVDRQNLPRTKSRDSTQT